MAVPTGAQSVRYVFNANEQYDINLEHGLSANPEGNEIDAALEAGADAILAYIQSQHPTGVIAGRAYIGGIAGDPWPSP